MAPRRLTPQEFSGHFEHFAGSAFRLEARDNYDVADEAESLAAFVNGQPIPPRDPSNDPWLALVARATAAGRRVVRVRIVSRPLTDYTRFEFSAYTQNASAGEEIRVLERTAPRGADQALDDEDFWLFDDATVIVLRYDEQGRFLHAEETGDVDRYLLVKTRVLQLSVDL